MHVEKIEKETANQFPIPNGDRTIEFENSILCTNTIEDGLRGQPWLAKQKVEGHHRYV